MFPRITALGLLLAATSATLLVPPATADDFMPPSWNRADPFAVTAEWEFFTSANPLAPDGPLTNVGVKGSGTAPSGSFAHLTGPIGHIPHDGDGAWVSSLPSFDVHIELDNIVDTEPVKHLWLQLTHNPGNIISIDTLGTANALATGAVPDFPVITPIDSTHTLVTWNLFPNPPWEQFNFTVTQGGLDLPLLDQIVLDTISVPEPSSIVLAVIGLAIVSLCVRRRRR